MDSYLNNLFKNLGQIVGCVVGVDHVGEVHRRDENQQVVLLGHVHYYGRIKHCARNVCRGSEVRVNWCDPSGSASCFKVCRPFFSGRCVRFSVLRGGSQSKLLLGVFVVEQ